MLIFNDASAIYKDMNIELIASDEEEAHYLAKIDDNVGIVFGQNRKGEIIGMAIRVTDPTTIEKAKELLSGTKPDET